MNFDSHPITTDVSQLVDSEAVKRSLRNLLQLKRGEVPYHPEIASGIRDSFFELSTPLTILTLKETILNVITLYEPRVKIINLELIPNLDGNDVSINLLFSISTQSAPISFTVKLERSR